MDEFNNIKTNTGFKVPDDYFNSFSNKMANMIKEDNEVKVKNFSLKPLLSIAAIFIGVLVVSSIVFLYINKPSTLTDNYDTLAYLEYNIDDFSDDLLYETGVEIDVDEVGIDFSDEIYYLEEEISDDELINNLEY